MLTLINEELFTTRVEKRTGERGDFYQILFNTSKDILRTPNDEKQDENLVTSFKTIASLISPEKNYNDINLSANVKTNKYNKRNVVIKADARNKYNANILIIAFPFNGVVKPIPESKQYRIYKGLLSVSEKYSIDFRGKKYKKILYLVIEPNMNLFREDHEYHTDSIDIEFDSYVMMRDKENPESSKTNHESMKLSLKKDSIDITFDDEVIDEFDFKQYAGTPLYITYERKDKNGENAEKTNSENKTETKYHNGIYSKNNFHSPSNAAVKSVIDLDEMMKKAFAEDKRGKRSKSFSFNNDDDNYGSKKRTGNKGKKSKKRR